MTVVVQTPFNQHTGNGVTTIFGFTFQLLATGDLEVSLDGVVQPSGYTISGLGVQAGGSVTFDVAPANDVVVDIRRSIPLARSTDYQQNGDLPSDQIDEDYDRLWQALQDAEFNAGLTVQVPLGDTAAPVIIPSVSDRAGKFLAFDGDGSPIAADTITSGVPVSAFMEDLLSDANATDARDTLDAAGSGAVGSSGLTMATARGLGRLTASTGAIEELTSAQWTANLVDAATDALPGKVELSTAAEFNTGTDPARVPPVNVLREQAQVYATAVTLTNQTAVDFTAIPAWAKRIQVLFSGVSTNGTSSVTVQLGDAGGVETSGYLGASGLTSVSTAATVNATEGFRIYLAGTDTAAAIRNGLLTLTKVDGNTWACSGAVGASNAATLGSVGGSKALSATLDRVRITTVGGTDQFDAGTVNITYE